MEQRVLAIRETAKRLLRQAPALRPKVPVLDHIAAREVGLHVVGDERLWCGFKFAYSGRPTRIFRLLHWSLNVWLPVSGCPRPSSGLVVGRPEKGAFGARYIFEEA